ncbi:magnesium transporter [Striga asiatica]|uniref:Magnesium transporter n=1 Tax=Striga asiatica TaxID=4170 RepID=A0A5A7RCF1_STRAF|nr:magnesium transporter [Striga asiatica]
MRGDRYDSYELMTLKEHGTFAMETEMSFKKKGVASRNWIALDNNGQGIILDLDKYDIMKRVEINARDLRIIDPLLSYPSAILGRGNAIVLNLEHIKAIITTDEVILLTTLASASIFLWIISYARHKGLVGSKSNY